MVDFFSLLKWQGFPVARANAIWEDIKMQDNFDAWQLEKRDELLYYLLERDGGYRKLVNGYDGQWDNLPILTKDIMLQCGLGIDVQFKNKEKCFKSSTSGSSGKPFVFVKDGLTHVLTWMLVNDRYSGLGISLNDLQARFYGIPLTYYNRCFEKLKDTVGHRYRFPVLDLSDGALNEWIELFKKNKFCYLYGYSYPIIVFSHYLLRIGLVLRDVCPSLKSCILTAEMCTHEESDLVERAMGVSLANEYGLSELGIVGFSTNNEWLLSDELIYTEVVDDNGKLLGEGEVGNIVCTSLFNRKTPFIRYQTGDLGSVRNVNGKKILTGLMGRREDMAILPSGKLTPGDTAFYYVFKDFASQFDVISEYKVVQKSRELFEIRYVGSRDLNNREYKSLVHFCNQSLEKGLIIEPIRMDILDRTRMGKFRRFVSEVKLN